jgi:acylaminoacyl-peptidase
MKIFMYFYTLCMFLCCVCRAVVEAGYSYTGREQVEMTPEFLARLRKVSPIQYADRVKAPTLLNIGKKDLRVPPSQGTLYYHTLNTYNVPCK